MTVSLENNLGGLQNPQFNISSAMDLVTYKRPSFLICKANSLDSKVSKNFLFLTLFWARDPS